MILKTLQWNANKGLDSEGVSELMTILINENIPVALLQEMGTKNFKPKFPEREWQLYGSGNVGILVHKNIRSAQIPHLSIDTEAFSTTCAIIYIEDNQTPITLVSVYRNHNHIQHDSQTSPKLIDPNVFLDWLEETITELPSNSGCFVIGGDFNIRAKELGSHKNDKGASRLINLGLSMNPEGSILNDGSITRKHWTTSERNIQSSAIDITLAHASSSSGIVFTDWKTNGCGLSDHMRITFNINCLLDTHSSENEMKRTGYRKKKFDNEESQNRAKAEYSNNLSSLMKSKGWIPANDTHVDNVPNIDPDTTIREMNSMIIEAALESELIQLMSPLRKFPLSQSRNYAWDKNCDNNLKQRRKCARILANAKKIYLSKKNELMSGVDVSDTEQRQIDDFKNKFIAAKTEFNKSIVVLRKAINNARNESWKSAIASINKDTPSKSLWDTVKKLGRKSTKRPNHLRPFLVKDSNGITHFQQIDQADCLAKHWESISKNIHVSYDDDHLEKISASMNAMQSSLSPIIPPTRRDAVSLLIELPSNAASKWQSKLTMEELQSAITSMNSKSKPGEDSISYEMIKCGGEIFHTFLLKLYNYCWATGIYPESWKSGIVIPLPKQADAININEFRPITLLSCVGKVFEKIVSERLKYFLERSGILTKAQFGFRPRKSTTDQLTRIVQNIHNGWEQGMDTLFVSFDVKKAFDTMWHDGLLYKLHQMGIRGRMLRIIKSYLTSRPYKVSIEGNLSSKCFTSSGVPQGGVLSPLLFIIFNNDSLDGIPDSINGSLFADDTAIFTHIPREDGPLRRLRLHQMQCAIDKIMMWSSKWRLQQGKVKFMVFHKKGTINSREGPDAPTFTINGDVITSQKTPLRFLGLFMDPQLDLGWHIDIILCRAKMRLNVLKSFAYKCQGSDQSTLRHLYLSWIRPMVEYAPTVIATATPLNLKKLDKFQYDAMRVVTSASATVSSRALHVEAGIEPMSQRHVLAGGRQLAKILRKKSDDLMLIEWNHWCNRPNWSSGLYGCPEMPNDPHDHIKIRKGSSLRISPFHLLFSVYTHLGLRRDDVGTEPLTQHLEQPPWRFGYQPSRSAHPDDNIVKYPSLGSANKRNATQKMNAMIYSMEVLTKINSFPGNNMIMFCDGSAHVDGTGGGGVGLLLVKGINGGGGEATTTNSPTIISIPTGLLSTNSSTECFGILALTSKALTMSQQGTPIDNFHLVSDSQTFVELARAGKSGKDGNYWSSLKKIESMKRSIRSTGKRWICWWSPGHVLEIDTTILWMKQQNEEQFQVELLLLHLKK